MRPIDVVARLPEAAAIFRLRRPLEGTAAMRLGDFTKALRLLGDARLGTVEFEEQHRRFDEAELHVIVEGAHGQRVGKLDACDRQSGLNRFDDRIASRLDTWK